MSIFLLFYSYRKILEKYIKEQECSEGVKKNNKTSKLVNKQEKTVVK